VIDSGGNMHLRGACAVAQTSTRSDLASRAHLKDRTCRSLMRVYLLRLPDQPEHTFQQRTKPALVQAPNRVESENFWASLGLICRMEQRYAYLALAIAFCYESRLFFVALKAGFAAMIAMNKVIVVIVSDIFKFEFVAFGLSIDILLRLGCQNL